MKKISKYTLIFLSAFIPVVSFSAGEGLKSLLDSLRDLMSKIVPLIFGLSVIYFMWGLSQFILHDAGNEKTREDGKKKMLWGLVALFVFVSIFGILNFISKTTGIQQGGVLDTNIFR